MLPRYIIPGIYIFITYAISLLICITVASKKILIKTLPAASAFLQACAPESAFLNLANYSWCPPINFAPPPNFSRQFLVISFFLSFIFGRLAENILFSEENALFWHEIFLGFLNESNLKSDELIPGF